jgi:mono/diheme cytochrome c family protein
MSKFGIVLAILTLVCVGAASSQKSALTPADSIPAPAGEYRAVINQYCVGCHNADDKVAGLILDKIDLSNVAANAETWEKVVLKLRSGLMPPPSAPHPSQAARDSMVSWLETSLDKAEAAMPNPGRPLLRRLNRAEYANAIRDLLALDVDASNLLPPDDSGYGFDNNADVLGVSPVLLERYLTAAGKISALAIGDRSVGPAGETFRIRQDASQDRHIEGLPLGTIGGMVAHTTLPLDGQYLIQVKYFRTNLGAMRGLEYPHQLEITVDGERVHLGSFGGDEDFKAALENITLAADSAEARSEARVPLKAGPHDIGVAFLQEPGENTVRLQPFIRSSNDTLDPTGHAHIDRFTVTGPFDPTGPGDTPSRRRILLCQPATAATPVEEETCAKKILDTLVRRAYRGLDSKEDSGRLLEFYRKGRSEGGFESGIQMALQRLLASPKFVFRAERDPVNVAPGSVYRVSDKELASRLSFFLWSSIPDDELLEAASTGKLKTPAVLEQQVKRMLADPRSSAIVDNFAGQWLYLRNLRNQVPNSLEFPDFDDNLRVAMQRETELFFQSIMREDRNVVDLMTADYTYVNERLAKHYGIPNVYGSQFRRVTLTGDTRRGLLGKGSILMVTSHTDRTSPVVRGKWILENLLGAPVPPPPANVPPLKETADRPGGKTLTMRERLEEHRTDPACSGCHSIMDPLGFALENFDAVGAYRTREARIPIDATGQLLDGTKVDGVESLRKALLKNPEMFVQTVTEKLMTYSLGRGLGYYDMPAVRAIVRDAATKDNRFSSIVMGIVKSTPFQMRAAASE